MKPSPIYRQNYVLTTNFYDFRNQLSLQGSLDLMQNCAARHAYLFKAGSDDLAKDHLYWVIARSEIEFVSFPTLPTEVDVVTWPLPPSRFYYDRHYQILDKTSNHLIAIGRSRWVLIDAETRKIVASNRFIYPLDEFHKESLFKEDFSRIRQPKLKYGVYEVQPSDIDENGHVNNSRYGNLIFNVLTRDKSHIIKRITINYTNEAFLNETIDLYKEVNGSSITISGQIDDKIIFSSEVIV